MKKRPGWFCTIPGYILQITRSLLAELRIPIQGKRTWRLLFSVWPLSCTCNTMSPRLLNYLKIIIFTLFIKPPALPTRIQPTAKSLVIMARQNKSVVKFIWQNKHIVNHKLNEDRRERYRKYIPWLNKHSLFLFVWFTFSLLACSSHSRCLFRDSVVLYIPPL